MATSLTVSPASLAPGDLPPVAVPGLYVHVPFCFHKCHYCDFYSITRQSEQRMNQFVDLLLTEADLWLASHPGPTPRPRTVFFGGGTPTLLPRPAMQRLILGLRSRFDFSDLREWTLEANPATVSLDYCQMLREAGVDRLSFGAQSFHPAELAILERHHAPPDVPHSIDLARQAGFHRLNLDLIYAIPGQDLPAWSASLEAVIALHITHVSCYGLTYEPNTAIAVKKKLGLLKPIDDQLELAMLHHTRRRLTEVNCPPYEISNYAAPGQECQHNLLYWQGEDYIGLGPSAASHVQGHRWRNRPHLGQWEQAIESGQLPAIDAETLSPLRRAGELVMLQLRLTPGINFADFTRRTGFDAARLYAPQLEKLTSLGLLLLDSTSFRLSDRGLDVADAIAAEFLDSDA